MTDKIMELVKRGYKVSFSAHGEVARVRMQLGKWYIIKSVPMNALASERADIPILELMMDDMAQRLKEE